MRVLGATAGAHIAAAIVAGALVIAGIFFVDDVLGVVLIAAGLAVALLGFGLMEWRTYRERSGAAFPADRGPGLGR